MKLYFYLLFLFLFNNLASANGRGPAVEDFVGIEIEEPKNNLPQGTESLFNFNKDMDSYKAQGQITADVANKMPPKYGHWTTNQPTASSLVGILFILGLPALTLFLIFNRFRQNAQTEVASNITVLEKYRLEKKKQKDQSEEVKKAS